MAGKGYTRGRSPRAIGERELGLGLPRVHDQRESFIQSYKRSRRMVVDYRELNKVTVRKFFFILNSDYIKSTVAGNKFEESTKLTMNQIPAIKWLCCLLADAGFRED